MTAKPRSALKNDVRQAQLRYIQRVMSETGLKLSQIARMAKLSHTVLTRFFNDPDYDGTLENLTIASIASATSIQAPRELLGGAGAEFREPDAEVFDYDLPGQDRVVSNAIHMLSENQPHIVPWQVKGRALEHMGWRAGDILLVDLNATPAAGDLVCVQIYDLSVMRAETVFRIYEPPFLVAVGPDPSTWKPLSETDRAVAIKGVVISTIRPRTARAA